MNKKVLIGTFVKVDGIKSYKSFIKRKFNIKPFNLNIYSVEGNKNEVLITFSSETKDVLKDIKGSFALHTVNKCLFTINAINKLIDTLNTDKKVPNNEFKIDWTKYANTLMLIKKDKLKISNLTKINSQSKALAKNDEK